MCWKSQWAVLYVVKSTEHNLCVGKATGLEKPLAVPVGSKTLGDQNTAHYLACEKVRHCSADMG